MKNQCKLQEIAAAIKTTRIVTEQQGAWRWQKPYRGVWYRARLTDTGRVLWSAYSRTGKMTLEKLNANGWDDDPIGTAHNRSVSRAQAIECIGAARTRQIENHGWRFEQ